MQLPRDIAELIDELKSGNNPGDIVRVSFTAIALVLTLLAALGGGHEAPANNGSSHEEGSSEHPSTPQYPAPPLSIQLELDTIRTQVRSAANEMRFDKGLGMLLEYPARAKTAQLKAETNSVTGKEKPVSENIGMLQAHLPRDKATAWQFIEDFRNSPEHLEVLMSPTNLHMAVGTAYSASDDTVWLVLQFE